MQDCDSRCQLHSRAAEIIIPGAWWPGLNRWPSHTAPVAVGINGKLGQQGQARAEAFVGAELEAVPSKASLR